MQEALVPRSCETDPDDRRNCIHHLADGRRIGYAEFGDPGGLPVLALHGTPGSRLTFNIADQAARKRGLRLISPDRPGYGLSDFRRVEQLTDYAGDIASLVDALGIRGFALIGVSGGGPYAVALASALSRRVVFMGLVSPVGPIIDAGSSLKLSPLHRRTFVTLAGSRLGAASAFWLMRQVLRHSPGAAARGLVNRASTADRDILRQENVMRSLIEGHREGLRPGIRGAVQDLKLFAESWGVRFTEIITPAVVWQGALDRNVPPSAAYYLADEFPHCRLDVLEGAGHYWMLDHFDEVLDAVEASLKA